MRVGNRILHRVAGVVLRERVGEFRVAMDVS